ncbi:MAG: chorismate-binding protein [Phycisphaerae bacterium]|nr:chorismate-binding protein [Phycisphaerae bacterium]
MLQHTTPARTARDFAVELAVQTAPGCADAATLFARLTNGGTQPGCVLLESGEQGPRYADRSIGVIRSALMVCGRGNMVEIAALENMGRQLLVRVKARLPRSLVLVDECDTSLTFQLPESVSRPASFEERLRSCLHVDVLRAFLPGVEQGPPADLPYGLFGVFAYDFVRHLEDIPPAASDPLSEPDYVFFLPSRFFIVDHLRKTTTHASVAGGDGEAVPVVEGQGLESPLESARTESQCPTGAATLGEFTSDTSHERFVAMVEEVKASIARGDVFQAVVGRMLSAPFEGDAFPVYRALKECNPSPFMFYVRDEFGVLLGASPELAVRVAGDGEKRTVELRPIAGTRPRGLRDGSIDPELDSRLEIALKIDTKELAEHTMLVDLARNDVASVCRPGTTRVEAALEIEKYSHVQHLVSRIRGELRDEFDALDAYVSTMNMGTLTGAPKPQAMRLIAELESSARGFFGGAVGFLSISGELETAIIIRAMRVLDGHVYLRAGAGIVADSIAQNEWLETERKLDACIKALKEASHGG